MRLSGRRSSHLLFWAQIVADAGTDGAQNPQRGSAMTPTKRVWVAALADTGTVLVFVAIGRRSHDEDGSAVSGAFAVAAPFLIGLVVAWLVGRVWLRPFAWRSGVIVWVATVVAGVLLRRFAFDRSTATGFIVVASMFTGALFNGWRAVARRITAR